VDHDIGHALCSASIDLAEGLLNSGFQLPKKRF
jgi:hypothetical protein